MDDIIFDFELDVGNEFVDDSLLLLNEKEAEEPCLLPSLFGKSNDLDDACSSEIQIDFHNKEDLSMLNTYEENKLLASLNQMNELGQISKELYQLRRKLIVRNEKRQHNLITFDIDAEVKFYFENNRLMNKKERSLTCFSSDYRNTVAHVNSSRVLDRFQVPNDSLINQTRDKISFSMRLIGSNYSPDFIYSPYSLRRLKPYIYRDYSIKPMKVKLLEEIKKYHVHRKALDIHITGFPIDFCYVTPKHIPSMNQLAQQFFWPGIDLSEVLQYPDYTCVVLYGRLVIGFGVLVPETRPNEAYISFLLVHPDFRGSGIGKFILYHLIQTSPGKDITLHVSGTNPALIFYQQFGFKVEEFLSEFYDKYFPQDTDECKHALFMRLRR